MNRLHMFAMSALVFSFAACAVNTEESEEALATQEEAIRGCGADCPDPTGGDTSGGTPTGGHVTTTGGGSSTGSGSPPPPPPPTPVTGLPQGLTGGLAYINHLCGFTLANVIPLVGPIAAVFPACGSGVLPACVAAGAAGVKAFINLGQNWCADPTINLGGAVAGVSTLSMPDSSHFNISSAAGWTVSSDGDRGNNASFGFYHQSLTAGAGGLTDTSVSTRFALPAGTACGFHHTQNTPANAATGGGLCMGNDPALGQCPAGWRARSHFDMSSDTGSFTWCEYLDPNGFCPNGSTCELNAASAGYAIGVASDTDAAGNDVYGTDCPAGLTRSAWFDDGRGAGQGLGSCVH